MFTIKNLLILITKNAIIALIFVSISTGAIFYINNKISVISSSIELKHKLEAELKHRTDLLSTLEKDAITIGQNETLINDAFIPSNNISKFTNTLDDLASKNKILQIYKFETPTASGSSEDITTSTLSYSETLTTDVSSFSNYLKNFETLPYFTKIESLNITSQDKNGWVGTSTASLKAILLTQTIQ